MDSSEMGRRGGRARAKALSPKQRQDIARKAAAKSVEARQKKKKKRSHG